VINGQTIIRGRAVCPGWARGSPLMASKPFMFAHGVQPETGEVIDVRSDICGENMEGKVLIYPFGKGSTTGSAWFLETIRQGKGPNAVINLEAEPIIVSAVTMARLLYHKTIPLVDRPEKNLSQLITADNLIEVDGNSGTIIILA
jgi:predicted aconitase with swiveling domain